MAARVCRTRISTKKGMHTDTRVTGKRQSLAGMVRVVMPKTPCLYEY
jgi:hypothetical protein